MRLRFRTLYATILGVGLLAELYVSEPARAALYAQDDSQFPDKKEFGGFTSLELATLWEILAGGDAVDLMDEMPLILEDEDTWIWEMPSAFLAVLTSATPDALRAANVKWAACEELRADPADTWPIVEALISHGSKAVASNRGLYFFNRL